MASSPPSLARGGRAGKRTGGCNLECGDATLGAAANRFPASLCGRDGSSRNRSGHGNERGNRENTSIPGVAIGSRKAGGIQMSRHLTALQISECFVGGV